MDGKRAATGKVMTDPQISGLAAKLPFLLILLIAGIGAFVLRDHLTFDTLARNRDALIGFRDQNYLLAALVFMLAYTAIVALSLPGATLASLTGGFLFGIFPGVLCNVIAATLGATLIFVAARYGFGARFSDKMTQRGGAAARLKAALQDNEWSALMIMRLVPVVPFFLANLIPAFMGVRTSRFAITTFFGIIPAAFVFTSVGAGLSDVFARGAKPDLSVILAPNVMLPMLGLAALSALPIVVKLLRKKAR